MKTPQPSEAHQRAKLSWHNHQLKGVFSQILLCLVCHCNVSSEWRVLIVGEDVREHGLIVTPWSSTIISRLAKERETRMSAFFFK